MKNQKVKKAIESTKKATITDGKGGVFWHTQGSGKSLSMVFYAHLLQEALDSPTIVVLTDRNDLDDQLYSQFVKCKEFLRQSPTILTNHKKKIQVMPEYMRDKKFVQTRNTRVNYVTVDVKEGFNDAFREIVLDEMKQSIKKEEGVYVIYAATATGNPNKWYFFEIYENEKAYQKHRKTAHFKKYIEQTENIIENKEFINIEGIKLLNKGNLNYVK